MGNSLFNMLGNAPAPNSQFGNMLQMMNKFNDFKSSFTGNPQEQIQRMLNSGQISQAQLNQYVQMAKQFQQILK